MKRIVLTVALGLAVLAPAPAALAAAPELKDCKSAADAEKKACLQGNVKALRKSLAVAINQKCKGDAAKAGQKDDALTLATLTCTEAKLQELYKGASQ